MSRSFNPYQVWLGLGELVTDPNYFELLGLDETEEDARTIAAAADRAASRVRRFRPGEQAVEWAALLDQIAAAKKCLTDPRPRSEYLQSLSGNRAAIPQSSVWPPSAVVPSRASVDPNMYPPGLAPAMAPASPAPTVNLPYSPFVPVDPQAAVAKSPDMAPQDLAMSPAGVPYLQPANPANLTDPMHPAVPAISGNPYSPIGSSIPPMAPAPMAPAPMAPAPMAPALMAPAPMTPMPAMAAAPPVAYPMAAVPVAMPVGAIPTAQALPYGATAYPMAAAVPASLAPAATQSAAGNLMLNNASAAMLAAKHARGGMFGPVLIGLAAGSLLLSIGAGYLYWKSPRGSAASSQVAVEDSEPGALEQSTAPDTSAQLTPSEVGRETPSPSVDLPPLADKLTEKSRVTEAAESVPAADSKPARLEPPATTKPAEPAKTDSKPAPDAKTTPAADMPAKPTAEELTKLGRAMQKARDAIGEHNFDRAEAFISAASGIPRLPEHQAMLDRLKLLSESVGKYRKAIQESIGKLVVASSFQVGDATVGVVETGPEKVVFRVGGQNRTYTIRDLPIGLAAALAAQTLAAEDPNTLTLKGAYVLASPRATEDDLKKAREFLEQASGSVDAAQDLLLLFKDRYDFVAKP